MDVLELSLLEGEDVVVVRVISEVLEPTVLKAENEAEEVLLEPAGEDEEEAAEGDVDDLVVPSVEVSKMEEVLDAAEDEEVEIDDVTVKPPDEDPGHRHAP